jgi:hypothetical protein
MRDHLPDALDDTESLAELGRLENEERGGGAV